MSTEWSHEEMPPGAILIFVFRQIDGLEAEDPADNFHAQFPWHLRHIKSSAFK
jgi:hypothetical protein